MRPESVEATLPFVSPLVAAMIRLQQLTRMGPCELAIMRPCDLDHGDELWAYEPSDHKNQW